MEIVFWTSGLGSVIEVGCAGAETCWLSTHALSKHVCGPCCCLGSAVHQSFGTVNLNPRTRHIIVVEFPILLLLISTMLLLLVLVVATSTSFLSP